MATNIDIVNAALTRQGLQPITSFTQAGDEAKVANANYEMLVEKELASYRWRWATTTKHLNRLDAELPDGSSWTDVYQIPSDILLVRGVSSYGLVSDFEQQSDKLLGAIGEDNDAVLSGVWRAPEAEWQKLFREGMIQRLEALFLRAIKEEYQAAKDRDKDADAIFRRAYLLDAQGSTPRDPYESSTLRARRA
jgi:hypothetical protein